MLPNMNLSHLNRAAEYGPLSLKSAADWPLKDLRSWSSLLAIRDLYDWPLPFQLGRGSLAHRSSLFSSFLSHIFVSHHFSMTM